jgi:hypothetical protein
MIIIIIISSISSFLFTNVTRTCWLTFVIDDVNFISVLRVQLFHGRVSIIFDVTAVLDVRVGTDVIVTEDLVRADANLAVDDSDDVLRDVTVADARWVPGNTKRGGGGVRVI